MQNEEHRVNVSQALSVSVEAFQREATHLEFDASCELQTAQFLTTLAASKPGGRLLELGTGVGLSTAYLLAGMNAEASLETVELEERFSAAAQRLLGQDSRVTFHVGEGEQWLRDPVQRTKKYDLIFADTWPGKFHAREAALDLLAPGGIYFIDDLFPQTNWPEGHQASVDRLRTELEDHPSLVSTFIPWASGLMVCVRKA